MVSEVGQNPLVGLDRVVNPHAHRGEETKVAGHEVASDLGDVEEIVATKDGGKREGEQERDS
jgi:hypothetical protein